MHGLSGPPGASTIIPGGNGVGETFATDLTPRRSLEVLAPGGAARGTFPRHIAVRDEQLLRVVNPTLTPVSMCLMHAFRKFIVGPSLLLNVRTTLDLNLQHSVTRFIGQVFLQILRSCTNSSYGAYV